MNRTMMEISSDLIMAVGNKAIMDGFKLRQPHMVTPFINDIMARHIKGEFDIVLKSLRPINANAPRVITKLLVRLEVKRKSQTKAYNDGHISKHHKHNRFVEKLLRMYLKDEIKLK